MVHSVLVDRETGARHRSGILALAKRLGVDGVDIDYENLRAGDRLPFTTFVRELADDARRAGMLLSVTVQPKLGERWSDGAGAADLKYATLIGGASDDNFFSVTVDPLDPTFVTAAGMSWSDNFPVTAGVVKSTNSVFSPLFNSQAAIVTRFHFPSGGPNTLVWSTYLGPPGPAANIRATDVAVNVETAKMITVIVRDDQVINLLHAGIFHRGHDAPRIARRRRADVAGVDQQ